MSVEGIKTAPVHTVVGGLIGVGGSAGVAGIMRASVGGMAGEVAGDIASFPGNVIGTEITGIAIKKIGDWVAPGNTHIPKLAMGARVGGYLALAINGIATGIKYATKRSELRGLAAEPTIMEKLKTLKFKALPSAFKTITIRGLGIYPLLPAMKGQYPDMGMGASYRNTDYENPAQYGLGEQEALLDAEISALKEELGYGNEFDAREGYGMQGFGQEFIK